MLGVIILLSITTMMTLGVIIDMNKKIRKQYKYAVSFKRAFKSSGLPLLKVKVGGKWCYLILDSGAEVNFIKRSEYDLIPESDKSKLEEGGSITGVGSSEPVSCEAASISVDYGGGLIKSDSFQVVSEMPTLEVIEKRVDHKVIGILGAEFFNKNGWELDFEEQVIWIKKVK